MSDLAVFRTGSRFVLDTNIEALTAVYAVVRQTHVREAERSPASPQRTELADALRALLEHLPRQPKYSNIQSMIDKRGSEHVGFVNYSIRVTAEVDRFVVAGMAECLGEALPIASTPDFASLTGTGLDAARRMYLDLSAALGQRAEARRVAFPDA